MVVRIGDKADLRIRHEEFGQTLPLGSREILIQPALAEELSELGFGHPAVLIRLHYAEMLLHVVASEQFDSHLHQRGNLHHANGSLVSVGRYAEIAAHHVLEADEQLELLRCLPGIEVLLVVGTDTTDGEVQPASVDVLEDRRDLEAEHHPFVVDGLVRLQELADRLVNRLRNASFDDMGDADGGIRNLLVREDLAGSIKHRADEALVRDGHLVVLGEDRDDAVLLEMGQLDLLRVRFDERKVGGCLVGFFHGLEDGQDSHLMALLGDETLLGSHRKECGFHDEMGLLGLLFASEILASGLSPALLSRLLNRGLLGLRVLWLLHRLLGILDRSILSLLGVGKVFTCVDVEPQTVTSTGFREGALDGLVDIGAPDGLEGYGLVALVHHGQILDVLEAADGNTGLNPAGSPIGEVVPAVGTFIDGVGGIREV